MSKLTPKGIFPLARGETTFMGEWADCGRAACTNTGRIQVVHECKCLSGRTESALLPFTHKSKSEERNFDICGSREIRILHDPQVPRPTRVVAKIMTLTLTELV